MFRWEVRLHDQVFFNDIPSLMSEDFLPAVARGAARCGMQAQTTILRPLLVESGRE